MYTTIIWYGMECCTKVSHLCVNEVNDHFNTADKCVYYTHFGNSYIDNDDSIKTIISFSGIWQRNMSMALAHKCFSLIIDVPTKHSILSYIYTIYVCVIVDAWIEMLIIMKMGYNLFNYQEKKNKKLRVYYIFMSEILKICFVWQFEIYLLSRVT